MKGLQGSQTSFAKQVRQGCDTEIASVCRISYLPGRPAQADRNLHISKAAMHRHGRAWKYPRYKKDVRPHTNIKSYIAAKSALGCACRNLVSPPETTVKRYSVCTPDADEFNPKRIHSLPRCCQMSLSFCLIFCETAELNTSLRKDLPVRGDDG